VGKGKGKRESVWSREETEVRWAHTGGYHQGGVRMSAGATVRGRGTTMNLDETCLQVDQVRLIILTRTSTEKNGLRTIKPDAYRAAKGR
jgi:hypothetical protein